VVKVNRPFLSSLIFVGMEGQEPTLKDDLHPSWVDPLSYPEILEEAKHKHSSLFHLFSAKKEKKKVS
jgi:hypothetical protein